MVGIGGGGGPGGKGGDGGSAEIVGDNGFAMGGEGGEAGQLDRGGREGRSPLEISGVPNTQLPDGTHLWDYGRGGDGASPIKMKSWWKKPEIFIPILIALVSVPWWPAWWSYTTSNSISDKPITQSHDGSGDNVAGDKNVTYSVGSLPVRELNEQVASCILDQLSRIGGKIVTFELYGTWVTTKNETGGGMFGQPPDNETINFTKQIATLLKEKNYEVDEMYTSISSFNVDEPAFTGLLVKKGDDNNTISILIGPNDGRQVACN
ncbi:MAG: hypothetical protein UZ19_OD1000803 [Parcubacteria bacterium OLB19]|nr:MAG: hypothetical protein UZ19_OD1000803 [Parcubacteria bacterium OLB19]